MADPPPRGSQDMSEAEKPTRKFWQLHLSTAVLLLLTVGAVMLVNSFPRYDRLTVFPTKPQPGMLSHVMGRVIVYGWPEECLFSYHGFEDHWNGFAIFFDL